ncbi:MAG: Fic family protein [Candidatus Caenarcaniphilales bacterium]|nr:Fic family protein [Candidatus Caenarcaniphilales bacterium]
MIVSYDTIMYKPPYQLNSKILDLVSRISMLLGQLQGLDAQSPKIELRKQNQVKSIRASLSIEGNTLTESQVTDLLEGKRVIGPKHEILEINNAIKAYQAFDSFNFKSLASLQKAHKIFMQDLIDNAGKIRRCQVNIMSGKIIKHIAPPPKMLDKLLQDLFDYVANNKEDHYLILSSVFHYEFEFIHPFSDGNGRLGRFWQNLILAANNEIFKYIALETIIKDKQQNYYKALEASGKAGESSAFIEFMLTSILKALESYAQVFRPMADDAKSRLGKAADSFGKKDFARKDYMQVFKTISSATASRDLEYGVKHRILKRTGSQRTSKYQFKKY